MWKEALLGCSAICGIGALAAFPNHAIAQSATIVRTGSVYVDIVPAIAAAIQGDTINVAPGTLWMEGTLHTGVTESTAPFVETDILFNCTGSIGAGPGPSRGCVVSGDNVNSYPAPYAQLIGKGLINIGQSGEYPNVTFDGFAFMNAAGAVCRLTLCSDGNFLSGRTAVTGQSWQFGGGNAAGIRYQAGNLTIKNSYFTDDDDGILADPFIQGEGTVIVSNSKFEFDGSTGQEHNMYISRVYKFTIDGSTSQESYNGQDLKCRAVICQVGLTTGNTFGSHSTLDFTGQQLQFPDGGQVDVRNNLIIKGPNSAGNINHNGNVWPVAYGGGVMPWATPTAPSHFNFIGNTILADPPAPGAHNNDYITNITPNVGQHNLGGGTYDVQITGNTFAGTAPLPAVLDGLGNQTGNINSLGSTWPATLNTIFAGLPIDSGGSWGTIINDSTVAGPVNLTLTTNPLSELVLGGSGALTVSTSSCAGCGIIFGSGGGTIWADPTTGASPAFSIADAVDGSSGNVFVHMKPNINAEIFGDNGTLTADVQGPGFLEIGGRNVTYNACLPPAGGGIAGDCGVTEIKHGIGSIIPNVTINGRGGRDTTFILQSGTGIFNGSAQYIKIWNNSDFNSSNGPSVSIINRTIVPFSTQTFAPFVLTGSISGDAYQILGPTAQGNFTHGGMTSATDSTHHNIWYPGLGPWEIAMGRDTVIFGSSTALALATNNSSMCLFAPGVQEAFVPGSGNATATLGCPTAVIEVINGQGTGTLNIGAYGNNQYPVTFLGFPATPGNTPTVNGKTESVAINGGPTLVFSAFTGAMNTALPAGAGSLTLAMGATQTIASNTTAALTGMAATDTWAAGFAGVMDLQLKPVNGKIVSTGTTIAGGTTGTILNTFAVVNSFLAGASFIAAGANGSVAATLWDQAGVKASGTKSIIVSGASANDMMLNLINGPFTILPGGSVVADVDLEDQFASGTAGTLNASIALQTNGAVIFHGTAHASTSGTSFTTFTVGESFAAMQTDLANMTYIGVSDPGISDVISVSVTNQGAFSQTVSVPITSLVQADMTLTVPATSTIAANSQDGIGVLVNINDAYAQSTPSSGFIFTANTDSGTLYLNGVAKPTGIVLNDTFQGANASIDQITYLGTQASTGTITWTATNQGGFSQSGSTVETVLAQGTTNDTTIAFPTQITISAGGSIAVGGVSVTDLYASTAGGPATLLASDTSGTLTFNGATFGPGQTGTLIDTLPNINTDIASLGYIAAGTANCDGIVLKFTNQGPFTTTKTISATVTAAPFSVTGPSSETIATNGTVAVPITLIDGSGVVGNDRAVITTTTGTIVISGQVHSPPVNVTLSGPASNLRTFLAGMQYIAAAGPGSDSIVVSATNAAGAQTSQVAIPVNVTTGVTPPGACPLPP